MAALALVIAGTAAPALAQDAQAEARLRRLEAEIRALQRKVFPGGDGKFFAPEIAPGGPAGSSAAAPPATTPVTELLTRMESVEAQMARLTARVEEIGNKLALQEAGTAGASPAPASAVAPASGVAAPAPAPQGPAAAEANLSAMSGGSFAPAVAPAAVAAAPVTAPVPAAPPPRIAPAAASATATPARPASGAGPTAQRLAAVRAIAKPQTSDPGDDEYSYGFRLWEAKLYPEAEQQLKLFVDRYPKHWRASYGRNLLGRAYLDDGKPREAASWFLQNYQSEKAGARAADSLLNLAESMRRLNDTNRACIALAEFGQTYAAEAAGRLKRDYDALRNTVKCNR